MEVVKAFNGELSSLYEGKPPISKAKMTAITKSAIKGIKFYKHIVQSVEKFVQKCRPEYKVPGLYVVDSIVRQSRHQFGQEKDVFAPRFTKNIHNTFQHLFKCPVEDRPKIVRVLNLWQKNQVFPPDVIQPLLDMASPSAVLAAGDMSEGPDMGLDSKPPSKAAMDQMASWKGWNLGGNSVQDNASAPPQETKTYALTQENLNLALAAEAEGASAPDPEMLVKLQSLASQLLGARALGSGNAIAEEKPSQPSAPAVKFNKKLLDFDYGDEEEEEEEEPVEETSTLAPPETNLEDSGGRPSEPNALALSMAQNLLNNPELLKQLQQMQQTLQQTEVLRGSETSAAPAAPSSLGTAALPQCSETGKAPSPHPQTPQGPDGQPLATTAGYLTASASVVNSLAPAVSSGLSQLFQTDFAGASGAPLLPESLSQLNMPLYPPAMAMPQGVPYGAGAIGPDAVSQGYPPAPQGVLAPPMGELSGLEGVPMPPVAGVAPPAYLSGGDMDERCTVLAPGGRDLDLRTGGLSPPRDRDRRRHSRSRSPRRRGRSRSRSPSQRTTPGARYNAAKRDRSREREKERERERDRRRKGLPPVKKDCLSVCSSTLWLGHVPKSVSETDLHDTFGEFGSIVKIEIIAPRGCAFVCMDRRQDAFRALQKLAKALKLQGSLIKASLGFSSFFELS
ncbi:SR-related and CTD-associated factor 8-like [Ixodes scapularis]